MLGVHHFEGLGYIFVGGTLEFRQHDAHRFVDVLLDHAEHLSADGGTAEYLLDY